MACGLVCSWINGNGFIVMNLCSLRGRQSTTSNICFLPALLDLERSGVVRVRYLGGIEEPGVLEVQLRNSAMHLRAIVLAYADADVHDLS
jgi:hypothetical protein